MPLLSCVFQYGCLALEVTCGGPQRLRVFLRCRAGTSTARVAVIQLLEKQSCEHQCNPAGLTSVVFHPTPAHGMAEQGMMLAKPASCQACRTAPSPARSSLLPMQGRKPHAGHIPSTFCTYLCCDPSPRLQSVGGSRTKQSMAMRSARTATSTSLRSLALRRNRASLWAQEGSSQQLLAKVGIPLGPTSPDPKSSAHSAL